MTVQHRLWLAVLAAGSVATPCVAQSLRGSPASINRMYHEARAEGLSLFETPGSVKRAVAAGYLERLEPNTNITLHEVGYPYDRPPALLFVDRLGAQYRAACGEQLQVTSAVRPATRQPPNSVARSVHPSGMAVDLHKTSKSACRTWLRRTLLELEGTGVLEATEEFSPPHFHVAIFPTRYSRYVASLTGAEASRQLASAEVGDSDESAQYRVREGDTLWDIARAHDTTVRAIRQANDLSDSVIQPGDTLIIPPTR
jgi:nucleoid-associated protein YgaU